mmetsp:Transcript_63274/g.141037  ORF Transcript_63274/g.141037 Transcript_63274/m.141037 type:complete len:82 (-) Transcript_63274:530-775(-)
MTNHWCRYPSSIARIVDHLTKETQLCRNAPSAGSTAAPPVTNGGTLPADAFKALRREEQHVRGPLSRTTTVFARRRLRTAA